MIIPLLIALLIPLSLHSMDQNQRTWDDIKPSFIRQALEHANISIYNSNLIPIVGELESKPGGEDCMNRRRTSSTAPMVQYCYKLTEDGADAMSSEQKDVVVAIWKEEHPTLTQVRTIEGILHPLLRRYALHLVGKARDYPAAHSQ